MTRDDISLIFVTIGNWGKIRGLATITFKNGLSVRGWKVIEGNNGLFVAAPSSMRNGSSKASDKKYENIAYCKSKEDHEILSEALLEAYNVQLELGGQSYSSYDEEGSQKQPPRRQRTRRQQSAEEDFMDPPSYVDE